MFFDAGNNARAAASSKVPRDRRLTPLLGCIRIRRRPHTLLHGMTQPELSALAYDTEAVGRVRDSAMKHLMRA